jgi:hypothetical protein
MVVACNYFLKLCELSKISFTLWFVYKAYTNKLFLPSGNYKIQLAVEIFSIDSLHSKIWFQFGLFMWIWGVNIAVALYVLWKHWRTQFYYVIGHCYTCHYLDHMYSILYITTLSSPIKCGTMGWRVHMLHVSLIYSFGVTYFTKTGFVLPR